MISSTTTTEVEWDEEQQAWMLALAEYRATYCDGCGEPLAESTHKDNEFGYTALGPFRCHACEEMARASSSYMESHKLVHTPGRWKVERKAVA